MKRSPSGDQTLDMNKTDFERTASGRKAKFTFNVLLHKGHIQNVSNPSPVAKDLATLLQEDEMTRVLVRQFDYQFSVNASFQLTIKNLTPATEEASGENEGTEESAG